MELKKTVKYDGKLKGLHMVDEQLVDMDGEIIDILDTVLESRVNVQRLDSRRAIDKRIKVEILNIYSNNRRAQSQMAWVKTP